MKVTIDVETEKFNRKLKKFLKNSNVEVGKGVRKAALDLLFMIHRPKPHGTHPVETGRARGAWAASMEGLGGRFNYHKGVDPSRDQVAMGRKEGGFVNKLKNKYFKYVELINGCPYIIYLEYGHSKSAPAGMVRISLREMRGMKITDKYFKPVFLKEWNKL